MPAAIGSEALAWPASKLDEAVFRLARAAGLISLATPPPPDSGPPPEDDTEKWIEGRVRFFAEAVGIESESVEVNTADLSRTLPVIAPALIPLPGGDAPRRYLAAIRRRRRGLLVLTPALETPCIPFTDLENRLAETAPSPAAAALDPLLEEAGISRERRIKARQAMAAETGASSPIEPVYLLRFSPGAPFSTWLFRLRFPESVVLFFLLNLVLQGLTLLGWWIIGRGVFAGGIEPAWLQAWGLLLVTAVPFHIALKQIGRRFSVDFANGCRKRFLFGLLSLSPDEIRRRGAGGFMNRLMETEALETYAIGGGIAAVTACVELITAVFVLFAGVSGILHGLLLAAWLAFAVTAGVRFYHDSRDRTLSHRELNNDLVERMSGHLTRLVQETPENRHLDEDRILSDYFRKSATVDRGWTRLSAILPHGWLLIGLAGMAPAIVGSVDSRARLAITLGGVLLARNALYGLTDGIRTTVRARIAWEQAARLFRAAERPAPKTPPAPSLPGLRETAPSKTILTAAGLEYRYTPSSPPAVTEIDLTLREGDRILLEGPSGSGKSTLAAILAGLRSPGSGTIRLWRAGADGSDPRKRRDKIVLTPQFHENHVMNDTFAANLLLGRDRPRAGTVDENAAAVCRDLGLSDLLERMPAGFGQIIGEGGWRLSHGEKTRLFIARALVQEAEVVILDESAAALDPESLKQVFDCVLQRTKTLVVVAHP